MVPPGLLWVELDHRTIVSRKAELIQRHAEAFASVLVDPRAHTSDIDNSIVFSADGYRMCAADLRDEAAVRSALDEAGLDRSRPTLVLAECVLVYLPPAAAKSVLEVVRSRLDAATVVVYEMIRTGDATRRSDPFGDQMVFHLAQRGLPLPGLELEQGGAGTAGRQADRLVATGWGGGINHGGEDDRTGPHGVVQDAGERRGRGGGLAPMMEEPTSTSTPTQTSLSRPRSSPPGVVQILNMDQVYEDYLSAEAKREAGRLERMDEFEEWHLLLQHYVLAMGYTNAAERERMLLRRALESNSALTSASASGPRGPEMTGSVMGRGGGKGKSGRRGRGRWGPMAPPPPRNSD